MNSPLGKKIDQRKILTAELKQLNYDFDKATTLQEKMAIHNLIVGKGRERKRFDEKIKHIREQNRVIAYAKIRKTKKKK